MQKSSSLLYWDFILNLNLPYELNNYPRNPRYPAKTFQLKKKKKIFGRVEIVRHTIKSKLTYGGWGIAFDG